MKTLPVENKVSKTARKRIPREKLDAFAAEFLPECGAKRWSAAEFLRELRAR